MKTYREILKDAKSNSIAIGHFNFASFEMLWGIVNAARSLNVPVLLGLAEGERDWVGVKTAVAIVRSIREEFDIPVYLNADHTYSFERVKEAIDAGFDSVIFDGAKLGMAENIKITKQCVDYARKITTETGRDIIVEAELGYIGEGSMIRDVIPEGIQLTTVEDSIRFVTETGVDLFAPAVGNVHGMLRGSFDPPLDINRISDIAKAVNVPLVLHGGSGTPNLSEAISAGISEVHISTELRRAWHDAMLVHLEEFPDDIAPYKVAHGALASVQAVVEDRLKQFSKKN